MFSLRPATEADFPAIRELIHVANINPTGLDWRRFVLAVTPDGAIIGCGQVKPHHDGSQELASIAVLPERRRQGIAKAIITLLLTIYIHYIHASHFMPHTPRSMSYNCRMAM
jgi:N-acetylglutamate synthase-like GNAT family acetyltransferase